jgi:hypothetical protein
MNTMNTKANSLQPGTKIRTNGTLGTPRWLIGRPENIAARVANADGIINARFTRDRAGGFVDVFYNVEHAPGAPVAPYRSTEFEPVQTEGELEGCIIQTIDSVRTELEALEEILAERFNLTGDVRAQLFELDRANGLVEDEVVADWHCSLAIFLDMERFDERAAATARLAATTPFCPSRLASPDPIAVDCSLGCCRRAGFPCDPTWNVATYCAGLLAEVTS